MSSEFKWCASCGRKITWRKKWERDWESVRYCSKRCRGSKPGQPERALEASILESLAGSTSWERSDRLRERLGEDIEDAEARERFRCALRRLWVDGKIDSGQNRRAVSDPSTLRGAFEVKKR